jgi:hypothetical protein
MRYSIDGNRVSRDWYWVLLGARASGHVAFLVTDGRRTMAEQAARVAAQGIWSPSNPHGAAVPSPTAPHIRIGRQDHALDVNALDGGIDRLRAWLGQQGLPTTLTVPGEPWHVEANSAGALHALSLRMHGLLDDPAIVLALNPLRLGDHSPIVRAVQIYLRRGHWLGPQFRVARRIGTYGPRAVRAVRAFQQFAALRVDGVVGEATFKELRRRYGHAAAHP